MNDSQWYYESNGQQAGPVTKDAIIAAIRTGRVIPGTRVWRVGLADWQSWESLPELVNGTTPRPSGSPTGTPLFSGNSYVADVLRGNETVHPLYRKAPFGIRLLAYFVDGLIAGIPVIVVSIAIYLTSPIYWMGVVGTISSDIPVLALPFLVLSPLIISGCWALWYEFTKDGRQGGQSVGKRLMGLMVVHLPTNQPCSKGQSALRNLIPFGLTFVPYIGWLVEPTVTAAGAGGRRLGDMAASTQVISATDFRES